MANIGDLVKIKSGTYKVWHFNKNDQPYYWHGKKDIIGTVIGSMNDDDGDQYNLAEYWIQYDREFLEGSGHREDWRPSELYLVQTVDGLLLAYSVKVIQRANPGAAKTKKCKGVAMKKATDDIAKVMKEAIRLMQEHAQKEGTSGLSQNFIDRMNKKWGLSDG